MRRLLLLVTLSLASYGAHAQTTAPTHADSIFAASVKAQYRLDSTQRAHQRQVAQLRNRMEARQDSTRTTQADVARRRLAVADSMRRAHPYQQVDKLNQSVVTRTKAPGYASYVPPVVGQATTTKRSSGPTVYYCASGNTVKYHSSASCRGLNRCKANTQKISLAEARQSMDACAICH